jgi:DNA-binding transcriptional MerR regulator
MQQHTEGRLLSFKEAAAVINVSVSTIRRYVKAKLLTPRRASYGKRGSNHRLLESEVRAVFSSPK